jgi:hypothetical protein
MRCRGYCLRSLNAFSTSCQAISTPPLKSSHFWPLAALSASTATPYTRVVCTFGCV